MLKVVRFVVPYTEIAPETDRALKRYAPHAERVDVSDDRQAYWRLLYRLWYASEDFAICEDDIEIHEDVLPGFDECPAAWCVHRYGYWFPSRTVGLGCVRLRGEVMRAVPDLFEQPAAWPWLILTVMRGLHVAGFRYCVHEPPVAHHRR